MLTVELAIETARAEGAVLSIIEGYRIEVRRPEPASERLAAALAAIRRNRDAALDLLRRFDPPQTAADALKGAAVLMVCDALGDVRLWIVADSEDGASLCRSGIESEDLVLDRPEVRELVRIGDRDIVHELLAIKRELSGRFSGHYRG